MNKFLSEDEIKGRHSEEKKELERQISQVKQCDKHNHYFFHSVYIC